MTPFEAASGILVYLIGSTVQGTLGFGANLFAVPMLALLNPDFVPGPVLIINPILAAMLTSRERGHVDGEALGWSLAGRLPGIVVGVVTLNLVSEDQLGVLFGVLLLGAVGLKACGLHPRRNRSTLLAAGTTSGFMGTTVGVGGPPVAMVLSDLPGPVFRATMSPYFLIGTSLSVVALAIGGQFGIDDLVIAAWLMPGVIAGALLSGPLRSRLDASRTTTAVYVLSTVAAVTLLVRSLV
ncbi:MAG TPA: sulfite exporter TauE/SafE family protein [Chloroflexota bacterium]|nr:sulfite exporter TauE/SafE family protein [Chloroflexota bacterium]